MRRIRRSVLVAVGTCVLLSSGLAGASAMNRIHPSELRAVSGGSPPTQHCGYGDTCSPYNDQAQGCTNAQGDPWHDPENDMDFYSFKILVMEFGPKCVDGEMYCSSDPPWTTESCILQLRYTGLGCTGAEWVYQGGFIVDCKEW